MFVKEDLIKFKVLKDTFLDGQFDIQGKAILAVASAVLFMNELEKKIVEDLKGQLKPLEKKPKVKKIDGNK